MNEYVKTIKEITNSIIENYDIPIKNLLEGGILRQNYRKLVNAHQIEGLGERDVVSNYYRILLLKSHVDELRKSGSSNIKKKKDLVNEIFSFVREQYMSTGFHHANSPGQRFKKNNVFVRRDIKTFDAIVKPIIGAVVGVPAVAAAGGFCIKKGLPSRSRNRQAFPPQTFPQQYDAAQAGIAFIIIFIIAYLVKLGFNRRSIKAAADNSITCSTSDNRQRTRSNARTRSATRTRSNARTRSATRT
jgi:hypothetical protein